MLLRSETTSTNLCPVPAGLALCPLKILCQSQQDDSLSDTGECYIQTVGLTTHHG